MCVEELALTHTAELFDMFRHWAKADNTAVFVGEVLEAVEGSNAQVDRLARFRMALPDPVSACCCRRCKIAFYIFW